MDDFVLCFQYRNDAQAFTKVLAQRLNKFHLELEEKKTQLIAFGRFAKRDSVIFNEKLKVMYFLGFNFFCGKNKRQRFMVTSKTEKSRFRRSVQNIKDKMLKIRHKSLKDQ